MIRNSFKLFTGLKINTDNEVVDKLSGYNFKQRADIIYKISMEKRIYRKRGIRHNFCDTSPEIQEMLNATKFGFCKRMPRELVT